MKKVFGILILILFIGLSGLKAQFLRMRFDHLSVSQGLSQSSVSSMVQDKHGFMWFATLDGLGKFDGYEIKTYYSGIKEGELPDNVINCLYATDDNEHQLWIGTADHGICLYDALFDRFINFSRQKDKLSLVNDHITSIVGDSKTLWIGTEKGFSKFEQQTNKWTSFDSKKSGFNNDYVNALLLDNKNRLWIATPQGIYIYDAMDPNSLSVNSIISIYEDAKHLLWIGTSLGGVEKWNRVAQELLVFRHNPYNSHSLSSSRVRCIFEDDDDIIWIGTVDGGLNKWDKDLQKFISLKNLKSGLNNLPGNHVRTIFKDSKKRYWIGTANNGLCILNHNTLKVIKTFKHNSSDSNSISSNSIWRITEKKDSTVWFATYGGGLCKLENTDDFVFKTFKHSDEDNSLSNDFCTTLYVDSKNRLWVGTNDGLNLFDDKNEIFTVFRNKISDPTTISNNRIYSIVEDVDGNVWIGTKGGLNKYIEGGSFESFTVKSHDLSNNVIMGILEDAQKNLWLTTNQGLCKFNRETFKTRTFDVRDGIQSNEFLVGSFLKTKDGMFIVGGINGFNAFYPEKIKNNPNIPSIVITDFMISNESVETDTNISEKKYLSLTHKQNDLTFKFVSIDYILPEKNQYAYKLVGYDDDWIYSKYDRIAKYTNLKPGHYIFRVKGSNNDLVWNEEGAEISIYIKPAIWQTLGFKIGFVLFVIFVFFFIAWLRMRALKRQKIYLEQEVNRQTKEIRDKNEELKQQKEEIETQRDEIEDQRKVAVEQRDLIAKHQKDMKDSIVYAKNIQTATMPANKFLQLLFEEYFILFKPRDIVSGDFYWASQKNGKLIAVAADCTGHGVPGAFMSMLGISFLHKIVNEKGVLQANKILDRLRSNVINSLGQTVDGASKDGMDISVCVIDKKNKTVDFAAANNSMYYIRDGELKEYKAEKMPIAIYDYMKPFKNHVINYKDGDVIYMFSDGYADQFGGPKSKKFKYANLKKILLQIWETPMKEQSNYLSNTLKKWMNYPDKYSGDEKHEQIDDIIIFGIRL